MRPDEETEELISQIKAADQDGGFEEFVIQMLDSFGFSVEDMTTRGYLLGMGEMSVDVLPDLPDEGLSVTFERERALSREDVSLMSKDHPIVLALLDQMLTSDTGNAAFGVWDGPGEKAVLLESHYVVECLAPAELHVERFLPSTPLWCGVDHAMNPLPSNSSLRNTALRGGKFRKLLANPKIRNELLPNMFDAMEKQAIQRGVKVRDEAVKRAEKELADERSRLVALAEVNDAISESELEAQAERVEETLAALKKARVRLDSVRMVWREGKR